jgi:uncharacterized protein (TIGR03435 family)
MRQLSLALIIGAVVIGAGTRPAAQFGAPPGAPGPPVDPNQQFEAASIKAADPSAVGGRMMMAPGRVEMSGLPVRILLRQALRVQDYQIIGVPDWATTERFAIVAKAPDGAPPNAMPVMLLNLLKDRFKLATHTETREMPIFHLVLARSDGRLGPNLKATPQECQSAISARRGGPGAGPAGRGGPPDFNQPSPCGTMRIGPGLANASGQPIAGLVQMLSQFTGRTVVDKTGLSGLYDFDLKYALDPGQNGPLGPAPPGAPVPPADPDAPTLVTAVQEQLGLKLENQRGPVDVIVIDHIERPSTD